MIIPTPTDLMERAVKLMERAVKYTLLGQSLGWTPLHWAAMCGHKRAVGLLLTNRAEVNARTERGWTPLHWASAYGHKDVVELLLASQADVNAEHTDHMTPLHWAAFFGHEETVALLLANGAREYALDETNDTPLHYAAEFGHTNVAKFLVAKGASVLIKNKKGARPLDSAMHEGHRNMVEFLGPVTLAEDQRVSMSTAVTYASKNSVERVRRLLKENPNFVYWKGGHDGHTFLHRAVMEFGEGSVEVRAELVKLLLANGADVNAKTNSGVTPLHWAAHWPWKDMVELLLTNGADVNARDEDGHRPSYFAAKFGRWDLVEILRRHGDDDPFLSFQSLQGNLDLWKSSAEPSEWVQKHRGGWSHNYWLELLASLRTSRYWPMDEAQIGRYLELLRTVFSEEQGAPDPAYSNEVHRLASALLLGGHSAFRSWPGVASGQQRLAAEEAAVALQQIGGEEAYLALARALGCGWYGMGWEESQGHCNNVLKAAYDAILALGLRAVPTLIRVLGNPTSDTRRVAAELLYELGEKRWYSLIKGEDEDIHRLGSCGDPRAVTSLLEALALGYEKAAAARFLGQIGDRRAIKPLLDMQTEVRGTRYADDDDARVVTEALRLLTS